MAIDILAAVELANKQKAEHTKSEMQKNQAATAIVIAALEDMDKHGTGDQNHARCLYAAGVLHGKQPPQDYDSALAAIQAQSPELAQLIHLGQTEPNLLTEFLRHREAVRQGQAPQQQRALNSPQVIEGEVISVEVANVMEVVNEIADLASQVDTSTDDSPMKLMMDDIAIIQHQPTSGSNQTARKSGGSALLPDRKVKNAKLSLADRAVEVMPVIKELVLKAFQARDAATRATNPIAGTTRHSAP